MPCPFLARPMGLSSADRVPLVLWDRIQVCTMAPTRDLFESSHSHLQAGVEEAVSREEESNAGELDCMVMGGGIAVRLVDGKKKAVPEKVTCEDLEMLKFFAFVGLTSEHTDAAWWHREDQPVEPSFKRSWARVRKDALEEPLYAPKLPGAVGSKEDFAALLTRVVELHNAGQLAGFITCGARKQWPPKPNVFPTLFTMRKANLARLKEDAEVKNLLSDIELEGGAVEAEVAGRGAAMEVVEVGDGEAVEEEGVAVGVVAEAGEVTEEEEEEVADEITPHEVVVEAAAAMEAAAAAKEAAAAALLEVAREAEAEVEEGDDPAEEQVEVELVVSERETAATAATEAREERNAQTTATATRRARRGAAAPNTAGTGAGIGAVIGAGTPGADAQEDEDDSEPIKVGSIIRAEDSTVVKKGVYGQVVAVEAGRNFGTVRWELPNGGRKLDADLAAAEERVAFEGRFKYTLEDKEELQPLALRSGLGAVASLHGKPLLSARQGAIDRSNAILTHVVPDLGTLQAGQHLKKFAGFTSAYMYASSIYELVPEERLVSDDESMETEESGEYIRERRLSYGQVFFEYKVNGNGMVASGGVEEMFVYVCMSEEYELHKPTAPDADRTVWASSALCGHIVTLLSARVQVCSRECLLA